MKAISSPTRAAVWLGALLLVAGFPELGLAHVIHPDGSGAGGRHQHAVGGLGGGGGQQQVYRLAGPALAPTRGG
jgi:hypothetical protein